MLHASWLNDQAQMYRMWHLFLGRSRYPRCFPSVLFGEQKRQRTRARMYCKVFLRRFDAQGPWWCLMRHIGFVACCIQGLPSSRETAWGSPPRNATAQGWLYTLAQCPPVVGCSAARAGWKSGVPSRPGRPEGPGLLEVKSNQGIKH